MDAAERAAAYHGMRLSSEDTVSGMEATGEDFTQDLVTDFFRLTEDEWSPEIFRRWCGIALTAAAAERRLWVRSGKLVTFLNLYTLLVAPPGTGKGIINVARGIIDEVFEPGSSARAFHVAPDSMTKAAFIDTLNEAKQIKLTAKGETYEYNALMIATEEFSTFMHSYDNEMIGVLNSIWNNPADFRELRRYGPRPKTDIPFPMVNWLAGIQPALMAVFPPEFWSTGLGRRTIMVYSAERRIRSPFIVKPEHVGLDSQIKNKLAAISMLQGEIKWSPEAQDFVERWCLGGYQPEPTHTKLVGYNTSRLMYVIKLAGISVISRGSRQRIITLADAKRALEWLLEVERYMPDIFRAMIGRNDWEVIEELHDFMVSHSRRFKDEPIKEEMIVEFLGQRLPSDKFAGVLSLAERSGVIVRLASTTLYRPGAKTLRKPE